MTTSLFTYLFEKREKSEYGMVPDFEESALNWRRWYSHSAVLSCHNLWQTHSASLEARDSFLSLSVYWNASCSSSRAFIFPFLSPNPALFIYLVLNWHTGLSTTQRLLVPVWNQLCKFPGVGHTALYRCLCQRYSTTKALKNIYGTRHWCAF